MSFPNGTTEHPLNKSKKHKIPVSIWDFGAISSKTERSHYKFNDHPAKMRPSLARAILQIYGESPVLDPMCGIGTTCVEASLLGMQSVGIEYEKKFIDQARKNIQHLRKLFPEKNLGKAKIIQGDARQLSKIFRQNAGSIIFSPPYYTATSGEGAKGRNLKRPSQRWIQEHTGMKADKIYSDNRENIGNVANYGTFNSIIFSPPYAGSLSAKKNTKSFMSKAERLRWSSGEPLEKRGMNYSPNSDNIGNIANYGENIFGSIVFSPPFADSKHHYNHGLKKLGKNFKGRKAWKERKNFQTSADNISNRPYGVFNSIVFSPPYSEGIGHVAGKDASEKYPWRLKLQRKMTETWSDGNIAKLKHGDNFFNSIIFSPPFGEANRGGGIAKNGYAGIHGVDKALKDRCDRPVSEDKNNITNILYGKTYLSEMFRVYSECYKVLKPGKFMVVVVKDIRRKNLTIPISADTIKLCQLAGFQLFDVIVNKLYFPSFWQINRAIKDRQKGILHPLRVHEYVLVFRKSN